MEIDCTEYWNQTERVLQLKREGRYDEVEEILLYCVVATETESIESRNRFGETGVAPWYYEQLAILYAQQKRWAEEVAILRRYAAQPKAAGAGPRKLAERLKKAEARLANANIRR